MRCDDVLIELVALDRGELAPPAAEAVGRHVAGCAGCAAELGKLRRVRALFVDATAFPAESARAAGARIAAAVDDALVAGRADAATRGTTGAADPSGATPGGRLHDLWAYARQRYEQSAAVRRVTFASIAIHAAAAVVLAVTLAGGDGAREPGVVSVTFPEGAPELASATNAATNDESLRDANRGFVAYEPMAIRGVAAPTGRVFPTSATARYATVLDPVGRASLLADAAGADAQAVDAAGARAVAWLLARQAEDGSFGSASDRSSRISDTACALLALGADGRTSADPAVARAAGWLSASLADDAPLPSPAAHANAVRALVRQFSLDFADLSEDARARRAEAVARASGRLVARQRSDGAFAAASGAVDVAGTVGSAVALADVRAAGLANHDRPLAAAFAAIDARRGVDGLLPASHADRGRGLSAALLAAERDLGRRTITERDAVLAAGERIARGTDPRGIAGGVDILRSAGRDVRRELVAAVGRQAADGAFREARVSDVEATSAGVLALRRAWRR